jgi:tetratricopeptide (TPR) repeat protein
MPSDVNALMTRAEAAFRQRRFDAARADLAAATRVIGDHPAVLHLLALVEQQAGRLSASRAAFARALALAPDDPQINNNYANLLDALGELEQAVTQYSRALATAPLFADARLNRATSLQKLGLFDLARLDLDQVIASNPADPRGYEARGGVHRAEGNAAAAAMDYERAVALVPTRPLALHGLARLATERNDDTALPLYRRAHAAAPQDPEVVLGYAEALEAAGEEGGIALLAAATDKEPTWIAGQDSLARMRSEAGTEGDFAAGYAAAVTKRPADRALNLAYWRCLARGDRHADALAALDTARRRLPRDPEIDLFEGVLASEAGDLDRADRALGRLDNSRDALLARGRHAIRRRDPARAAAALEPVARADLGLVTAWAHLAIAWRMLGDPRARWLCDQPGLYGARDLPIDPAALNELAETLRGLHRTRAHPIGQSLRGGTQTRGRLFDRTEPAIIAFERLLHRGVIDHVAALPPVDKTHPLLRHRDQAMRFGGNWSVRLSGGGFHVNHVHPQGVLSSACYVALPDTSGVGKPGWLELGAPPAELGLDLPPLATIEPRPGRLILFPSYLYHGTRPFAMGERLTVAFDVIV